jgi:hypothetical protein
MRKQYHFWPGEHGLDAWDVDRLVAVSDGLPVKEVALDAIWEVDTVYWFKEGLEQPTVRSLIAHIRLVHEVDTAYPIILGHDGRVMDGMHRIVRAILEERGTIRAVQFVEPLEPDYRDCRPEDLPY